MEQKKLSQKIRLAKVFSVQADIQNAHLISIETDVSHGLHQFLIVGLTDKAINEARERVGSALKNAGFESPKHSNKKTIVSLAPAHLQKNGPSFDLPIAISFLLANGAINFNYKNKIFIGELALNGEIKGVRGAIACVVKAKNLGMEEIYIPKANASEVSYISGIKIFCFETLKELAAHLEKPSEKNMVSENGGAESSVYVYDKECEYSDTEFSPAGFDLVRGQDFAKRGLLIAACGRHNSILCGPPGSGKSLMAQAFCSILPNLEEDESIEATTIHSFTKKSLELPIVRPVIRSPHHSATYSSLVGKSINEIGEMTLAHKGVLFMDELPEFDRRTIESLREPMESGVIDISRANEHITLQADFLFLGAMNPTPSGYSDETCPPYVLQKYLYKISSPIIDRIDLWINVKPLDFENIFKRDRARTPKIQMNQEYMKTLVKKTRVLQKKRGCLNAKIHNSKLQEILENLDTETKAFFNDKAHKHELTGRGIFKTLKVARTIADMESASQGQEFSQQIKIPHIQEALLYRKI